jgi:RNA polymerase sigma-70 factor (ECF subfamily)
VTPSALGDVLAAAQLGQPWALTVIYHELADQVQGYLISRGASEPDELTQDVFLAVFAKLPSLTGGVAGLRTFVFSVAHARLVDSLRARARRPPSRPYQPESDARSSPSAEDTFDEHDSSRRAMQLLTRLPADQRNVLALRILGELSLEETAAVIGRSRGAVQQLQRRALIALKSELQRDA